MTMRIAAPLRVADLDQSAPTPFDIVPDADALRQIAADLDLNALRKVRFSGQISAEGKRDWLLTGNLGATVVQPCVVTLAPVTTRIETDVRRQYTPDYVAPEGDEVEMPDDDTLEPLTHHIDLGTVLVEALALALPLYPRADDAALEVSAFTEPGKDAMTDDDAKPFAGLAALKDAMKRSE